MKVPQPFVMSEENKNLFAFARARTHIYVCVCGHTFHVIALYNMGLVVWRLYI
jgi:hypothetical protein